MRRAKGSKILGSSHKPITPLYAKSFAIYGALIGCGVGAFVAYQFEKSPDIEFLENLASCIFSSDEMKPIFTNSVIGIFSGLAVGVAGSLCIG